MANREAEIETIQGQLRVLDDQSTLGTITVRYTEKAEGPKVDKDLPGFVQALKTGGVAVVTVLKVLLAVLGWVPPGGAPPSDAAESQERSADGLGPGLRPHAGCGRRCGCTRSSGPTFGRLRPISQGRKQHAPVP